MTMLKILLNGGNFVLTIRARYLCPSPYYSMPINFTTVGTFHQKSKTLVKMSAFIIERLLLHIIFSVKI